METTTPQSHIKNTIIVIAGFALAFAAVGCGVPEGKGNPPGLTLKSPMPPEKPLGTAKQALLDKLKAIPQGERQAYVQAHPRMAQQMMAFGKSNKTFIDALAGLSRP